MDDQRQEQGRTVLRLSWHVTCFESDAGSKLIVPCKYVAALQECTSGLTPVIGGGRGKSLQKETYIDVHQCSGLGGAVPRKKAHLWRRTSCHAKVLERTRKHSQAAPRGLREPFEDGV
jgi:hypothetical protein